MAAATAVMLGCGMIGPTSATASTSLKQMSDYANPTRQDLSSSITHLEDGIVDLDEGVIQLEDGIETVETIEESTDSSLITLATDVLFDFDSADLSDEAQKKIAELGEKIPSGSAVTVAGHTDSQGADDYNQDLSERRAEAVAEVLAQADGSLQVDAEGHGSKDPIASETTDGEDDSEGRGKNRRVEITFDD